MTKDQEWRGKVGRLNDDEMSESLAVPTVPPVGLNMAREGSDIIARARSA